MIDRPLVFVIVRPSLRTAYDAIPWASDDADQPSEIRLIGELVAPTGRANLVTLVGKYAAWNGVIEPASAFPIPQYPPFLEPQPRSASPAHLLAVTRQESVFSSDVVSRAGARGLMQLMPATAALVARQQGLPYNAGLLTGAPHYNIRLGGAYLNGLLRRYREPALAFAAYNAGPGRVDSWLDLHGDPRGEGRHALIDWIELIPFAETRNYVQRVSENLGVYERRRAELDPLPVVPRPVIGPVEPAPVPQSKPLPPPGAVTVEEEAEPPVPEPAIIKASFTKVPVPWRKPPAGDPPPVPRAKPRDR